MVQLLLQLSECVSTWYSQRVWCAHLKTCDVSLIVECRKLTFYQCALLQYRSCLMALNRRRCCRVSALVFIASSSSISHQGERLVCSIYLLQGFFPFGVTPSFRTYYASSRMTEGSIQLGSSTGLMHHAPVSCLPARLKQVISFIGSSM